MNANPQNSSLQEFAHITSFALDMAIIELESGDVDLCLDTLKSLNSLLLEIAASTSNEQLGIACEKQRGEMTNL